MATVSGDGSQWITANVHIGTDDEGTLNINAGGKVQTSTAVLGTLDAAVGDVTVSGVGSQWNNSNFVDRWPPGARAR